MNSLRTLAMIAAAAISASAFAQTIDPDHKHAWGENVGFLSFLNEQAGSPPGQASVEIHTNHLSGYIWGENIGWINVGNGNGPYKNLSDVNFGVNLDPTTKALTGYAWGENVGWINFAGGALASPANPARIEGGRFRGYAWGENIGWINLDDATHYVGVLCPSDLNGDGFIDFGDIQVFINLFLAQDPAADLNQDTIVDFGDLQLFIAYFLAGC